MAFQTVIAQTNHTGEQLTGSLNVQAGTGTLNADCEVTIPAGTFTVPTNWIECSIEEGLDAQHPQFNNCNPATFDGTRRWRVVQYQRFQGNDQAGSRSGKLIFGIQFSPNAIRSSRLRLRTNSSVTTNYGVNIDLYDRT